MAGEDYPPRLFQKQKGLKMNWIYRKCYDPKMNQWDYWYYHFTNDLYEPVPKNWKQRILFFFIKIALWWNDETVWRA